MLNAYHFSQTPRVHPKEGVPQKEPDEKCGLFGLHVKPYQGVSRVRKLAVKEISIPGQERRILQPEQQRQDVIIADSLVAKVSRDGSEANVPLPQQIGLVARDIFVQDVHATAATSSVRRPSGSSRARRASWTASAMASLAIFPSPHR